MDTNHRSGGRATISKLLIFSYIFDWIVIILITIVGGLFALIKPNHRPFFLYDPDISFPYTVKETISTGTLVLVGLLAPAVIVFLVCLIFVPGPTATKEIPKSLIWRRKLWELNTGWMGLALALASTFMITDAMKNLYGKPRPDLLSRCMPDLANIAKYAVGGFANTVQEGILVSYQICTQPDQSIINDGFAAFPSGHSSFSWAGLTYLTLFLCSKFAITIPYLLPGSYSASAFPSRSRLHRREETSSSDSKAPALSNGPISNTKVLRSQAAAPPTYLLVLVFIPIGAAIYISSSRYSDYRHRGFDILFGSTMGFLLGWGAFRWYHAPIRQGAGWAWGPRSSGKAFAVGLGVQGYAGEEGLKRSDDLEQGVGRHDGAVLGNHVPLTDRAPVNGRVGERNGI